MHLASILKAAQRSPAAETAELAAMAATAEQVETSTRMGEAEVGTVAAVGMVETP